MYINIRGHGIPIIKWIIKLNARELYYGLNQRGGRNKNSPKCGEATVPSKIMPAPSTNALPSIFQTRARNAWSALLHALAIPIPRWVLRREGSKGTIVSSLPSNMDAAIRTNTIRVTVDTRYSINLGTSANSTTLGDLPGTERLCVISSAPTASKSSSSRLTLKVKAAHRPKEARRVIGKTCIQTCQSNNRWYKCFRGFVITICTHATCQFTSQVAMAMSRTLWQKGLFVQDAGNNTGKTASLIKSWIMKMANPRIQDQGLVWVRRCLIVVCIESVIWWSVLGFSMMAMVPMTIPYAYWICY